MDGTLIESSSKREGRRILSQPLELNEGDASKEEFSEIFKKTPPLLMESSVNQQLLRLNRKAYQEQEFKEPEPDKLAIRIGLIRKADNEIHSIFPWRRKRLRMKYVEEKLPIIYNAKLAEWKRRREVFYASEAFKKKDFEEHEQREYDQQKAHLMKKLSHDPSIVSQALKDAVSSFTIPGDLELTFFLDLANETVYANIALPK